MTGEVLVTIRGVRVTDGEEEEIDLCVPGSCFQKNGKYYILCDGLWEQGSASKTTIKLEAGAMEILRKGSMGTRMRFEQGRTHVTDYRTGAGNLVMEFVTNKLSLAEHEKFLEAEVDYSLKICGEHVSDCRMKVSITDRTGMPRTD